MISILNSLEKNPNEVKRLLGINLEQLDKLIAQADLIFERQAKKP